MTAESVMAQPEFLIRIVQQDCVHEEACGELQDLRGLPLIACRPLRMWAHDLCGGRPEQA